MEPGLELAVRIRKSTVETQSGRALSPELLVVFFFFFCLRVPILKRLRNSVRQL